MWIGVFVISDERGWPMGVVSSFFAKSASLFSSIDLRSPGCMFIESCAIQIVQCASRNLAISSMYSASWNNCLKTIHVSLTCENQLIKYLARDPRVDICISLQLYHEKNYTTMPSPDLIGRLPGISIWELHRQTYTNTTPVPCVCTICSPSCHIARKLLSIPTRDIALRWLADGLCVLLSPWSEHIDVPYDFNSISIKGQ